MQEQKLVANVEFSIWLFDGLEITQIDESIIKDTIKAILRKELARRLTNQYNNFYSTSATIDISDPEYIDVKLTKSK